MLDRGNNNDNNSHHNDQHETKVKEGTAKRNITRKKTADKDSGNYNSAHKKQGGHGKGQWKAEMDPVDGEELPIDEDDPIYDQAEDSDRYILTSIDTGADKRGYDETTAKAVYGPMLTLQEFKFQLLECLKEYFDSCDTDEVIRTLEELRCPEFHSEIPKKAISLALDKGPRERELISRLLTCLHPTPLSMAEMQAGFVALLDSLDDLTTDVPDAYVSQQVVVFYLCGIAFFDFVSLTFCSRPWWRRFLQGPLSMKYFHLLFSLTRTTSVRVTL